MAVFVRCILDFSLEAEIAAALATPPPPPSKGATLTHFIGMAFNLCQSCPRPTTPATTAGTAEGGGKGRGREGGRTPSASDIPVKLTSAECRASGNGSWTFRGEVG